MRIESQGIGAVRHNPPDRARSTESMERPVECITDREARDAQAGMIQRQAACQDRPHIPRLDPRTGGADEIAVVQEAGAARHEQRIGCDVEQLDAARCAATASLPQNVSLSQPTAHAAPAMTGVMSGPRSLPCSG